MADRPKVCIDRILPRELMRLQPTKRTPQGRTRAISPIGKTWMNGSTLRVRFNGCAARSAGPSAVRRSRTKALTEIGRLCSAPADASRG